MKKIFTLLLLCSSMHAFAQLTPIKEVTSDLKAIKLTNGEWMLYSTTEVNDLLKSVTLYKSDLSVYKTIEISQTFPFQSTDMFKSISIDEVSVMNGTDYELNFTDKFFNTDDKIEFIVKYNSETDSKCVSIIMNEDGNEIQRFSNLNGRSIGFYFWKYLNIEFRNEKNNEKITKIFSIPGNLPCPFACGQKAASISPIDPSNAVNKLSIEGFPNPTSEKITLAYTLPKGSSYGTIRLYSQSGTLVKEFKVSDQFDHLELPVADYAAGTYFYELQVDGNSSGGKKMLIVH